MYEFLSNIARENTQSGVFALMFDLKRREKPTTTKLFSCSAQIKYYNGGYIVLQSYSTDVCVYIPQYDIIAVYDIFSNTTAQHIHKFSRKIGCSNFLWAGLKSDNIFIECPGLIYGTYQKKHERINISYHNGIEQLNIMNNLINWLIGQKME